LIDGCHTISAELRMLTAHNLPHTLPPNACDCHVHVVGDTVAYPMVAERHYTPGPATLDDSRLHLARNGLERAVIIQPSFYGTDNRCMLQALRDLAGAGRGVAVLEEATSDEELRALHSQGIRGLRLNVESSGTGDTKAVKTALTYWSQRIAALGWHIQIYAALDALYGALPLLQNLGVPVVLDHFAMVLDTTPSDDARAQAVLSLVRSGSAYVKLSAPYRIQPSHTPNPDAVPLIAARFLQANPERVLWGSDWPHTNREPGKTAHQLSAYRHIEPTTLLEEIHTWLPTAALRNQVLVDNPARLYGF
jgi:predicted TIM-barrel fold metal-dependent hydrolase